MRLKIFFSKLWAFLLVWPFYCGSGHKFHNNILLILDMLQIRSVNIWPRLPHEEYKNAKLLTHDARWTTDDERRRIAKGQLIDSGELKSLY